MSVIIIMGQLTPPTCFFRHEIFYRTLVAAQLIQEHKLNADSPVIKYVPELSDSAWGDMKVRDVLDMTGAVRYREVYTDPSTEIFGYMYASGMLRSPPNYTGPRQYTIF